MDRKELLGRFDMTDRVAIVTGGSRGIARAVVGGFAAMGAKVVIASRNADDCERAAAKVTAAGGTALAVPPTGRPGPARGPGRRHSQEPTREPERRIELLTYALRVRCSAV